MENAVESKKTLLILNSFKIKHIAFLFCILVLPLYNYAQENNAFEERWKEINNDLQYEKPTTSKGPSREYINPQNFDEDRRILNQNDAERSGEEIIVRREENYANGSDNGVEKRIKKEEESPRKVNRRNKERQTVKKKEEHKENAVYYKIIFIFIGALLLIFLILNLFFKKSSKANKDVGKIDYQHTDNIDPEHIPKSKLEQDLQKAIAEKEYRTAIRIYYILLLKTLINQQQISWEKRKTNQHYLIEMQQSKTYISFQKAVRIYEYTWYGKNTPELKDFERYEAFFNHFLSQLKNG